MKKFMIGVGIIALATTTAGIALTHAQENSAAIQPSLSQEEVIFNTLDEVKNEYREWLTSEKNFLQENADLNSDLSDYSLKLNGIEEKINNLTDENANDSFLAIESDFENYYKLLESDDNLGFTIIANSEEMKNFYQDFISESKNLQEELRNEDQLDTTTLENSLNEVENLLAQVNESTDLADPLFEKINLSMENYFHKLDLVFTEAGYENVEENAITEMNSSLK